MYILGRSAGMVISISSFMKPFCSRSWFCSGTSSCSSRMTPVFSGSQELAKIVVQLPGNPGPLLLANGPGDQGKIAQAPSRPPSSFSICCDRRRSERRRQGLRRASRPARAALIMRMDLGTFFLRQGDRPPTVKVLSLPSVEESKAAMTRPRCRTVQDVAQLTHQPLVFHTKTSSTPSLAKKMRRSSV